MITPERFADLERRLDAAADRVDGTPSKALVSRILVREASNALADAAEALRRLATYVVSDDPRISGLVEAWATEEG